MYNGTNTEWLRNRAPRYYAAAQALPLTAPAVSARDLVLPAVRWLALLPSWTFLAMILLATSAVCTTVIMKARTEFQAASSQRQKMAAEIETLGRANRSLELEIRRLTVDSNTIELAARERLGMVMPSDVVVPIDSVSSTSSLRSISFVR